MAISMMMRNSPYSLMIQGCVSHNIDYDNSTGAMFTGGNSGAGVHPPLAVMGVVRCPIAHLPLFRCPTLKEEIMVMTIEQARYLYKCVENYDDMVEVDTLGVVDLVVDEISGMEREMESE